MNKLAPFTQNQAEYLKNTLRCWFNVAEGGKRGGKNVIQTLAFCMALETHPNKLHLIAGVSQTTAKLNIIDCDGYGLSNYFEGRCREGKYKDRACLYIKTRTGEKIILVSGGGKKGDEKYIKGNTYGMAYITEANECHPDFIKEAFDRTLSSKDRKIFHDLNPKAPKHWYYVDVLGFHEGKQKNNKKYGYNYSHFTIADNLSIDDNKLKEILSTYDKQSVWYKRDIKGDRCIAEGLIYPLFADNPERYDVEKANLPNLHDLNIGIDFGGNKSGHATVLSGIGSDGCLYFLKEDYRKAKGTRAEDVVKWSIRKINEFYSEYPYLFGIYPDSAEQTYKNSIAAKTHHNVYNSLKRPIIDRIRIMNLLLASDRVKFVKGECKELKKALSEAVWVEDSFDDERLDDGTFNNDIIDAAEYSFEYNLSDFERW